MENVIEVLLSLLIYYLIIWTIISSSFRRQFIILFLKPLTLICCRLDYCGCVRNNCVIIFSFGVIDWFDGLHTFMRNICHKNWLGGWYMPQKKSYFALKLPKEWWVFGLDLALNGDIDEYQFQFFSKLSEDKVIFLFFFVIVSV
jgi:hypothetical protein